MNTQEKLAFPVEKFLAAGIPREATVKLSVSGVFYAYGEIKPVDKRGREPTNHEFNEIASRDERREVREVEVYCANGGMAEEKSLEFTFEDGDVEGGILEESHHHPVAVFSVWFSCGKAVQRSPLKVADLAFVTYQEGLLWLEGEAINWEDEDFDGYPDHEVMVNGERFSPEQFWCAYGGKKAEVFDGLMTLQQRARSPWGLIRRKDAGMILRDMPERWTAVARDFIQRHGRAEAEVVLGGADNLDALLHGDLWERLTAEPVEDKRQLHLWP